MKKVALIMAGGRGERFLPRSRKKFPKQFLSLTNDGRSMIQQTVERILPLIEMEDIFIVTNKDYKALIEEQLPDIPKENILCEPIGRNTAPCIGLGAIHILKKYGDATMVVLPSDHLIKYESMFINTLKDACDIARDNGNLVTIGIMPTYPETGYGYIKINPNARQEQSYRVYPVDCFVEKPDLETAKEYLKSGEYLWNSGMFVWKASSLLQNLDKWLPNIYQGLLKIEDAINTAWQDELLEQIYREFESISIDYGVMEKAQNIYILPGTFGWDDVGNWLAIERINSTNELGNIVNGNIISVDTKDCIIEGMEKLIAVVGLKDIIIVDTQDATLICDKEHTQDIKKVIENLKICNRNEYI